MRAVVAALRFKRLGLVILALAVVAVGALALMPTLMPADKVSDAVRAEIRAATGLDPVLRGSPSVSLFPSGSVSFADVALGNAQAGRAPLVAEQLTARLRFFPLLAGRVEIADVSLARPTFSVVYDADGRSNWAGLLESLARVLVPGAVRSMPFSELRIEGGTVHIRDESRGVNERLTDINLALAWPSISRTFGATGRFSWRGEPVDASLTLNNFFAAIVGDRSGLKMRLASAPLKLSFDGALSLRPSLKIEGTLAADTASLRETMRWAGLQPLPGGGFGRFSLKAQTNAVGGSVALTNVSLELDGNAAEGVLTFTGDGRQNVQGTLAAEGLDLSPYVSTFRLIAANEREWNRVPIAIDGLASFDLDIRLSAARIAVAGAKIGRTAIAANLRGGRLTVAISESQAFGGVIKGSVGLAKSETGADFKAQLQFADVDLEHALSELFGVKRLEGKGTMAIAVDASGPTVLALARTLSGTASLTGRQGALTGVNVEQLLRRLEQRPLSGGGDFRGGRTPFEKLTVTIKIAQGTAMVEDVRMEGSAVRLALAGSASIPSRDFDLKGTASLLAAVVAAGQPEKISTFELPFVVQGPWDDPILLPDTQSLIRRSGSGAPLFDAVRDRRARDAVRAAIERLTGGMPAPITPPPAPPVGAAPPETPAAQPVAEPRPAQ
jgi:AsmA protein